MNSLLRRNVGRRRLSRRNHPALVFACETVERRLLLASVSGTVFHDVNANGVHDFAEGLQSGFRIYVDANGNGTFDEGERYATSDNFGNWRIDDLPAGQHIIRQQPRDGFTPIPSTPPGGAYHVTLPTVDTDLGGYDFGNMRFASATGRVFFDANANGREDTAESGLAGITVFVDANNNGILDPGELSRQTNANGEFRLDFLRPGFNRVRVEAPTGLRPTVQAEYAFVFTSGYNARNLNFGLTDVGEIHGRVFSDLNGDTFQGRVEPGIAGRVVFLDYNGNGILDPGEARTLTNEMGDYAFRGLKPGRYRVQVVKSADTEVVRPLTNGYAINLAPSQVREDINFAMAPRGGIRGVVFNDINASGTQDLDELGIVNRRVFLDLNGNRVLDEGEPSFLTSANGEYRFTGLPSGRYFVDSVVPPGQFQTTPGSRHIIQVHAGRIAEGADFGHALHGYVAGTVFSDQNGNRAFDIDEPRLANRRVYIDANNDGVWNPGEISTMTNDLGQYVIGGLTPGQYVVRAMPITGAVQNKPADGAWVINIRPGTVVRNRDFGFTQFASVSGTVYVDSNANAQRDFGEPARAGETVYLDLNGNGILDAGEPTTTTNAGGGYTFQNLESGVYNIRLLTPAGFGISEPGPGFYTIFVAGGEARGNLDFGLFQDATVIGTVYSDVNENGEQDGGDLPLSGRRVFLDTNGDGVWNFGEPSDLTDINGEYAISGVQPGIYQVRVVITGDEEITEPIAEFYDVTVTSGQTVANRDFGLRVPAGISGVVWEDSNGDGSRDPGENGIAGRVVFIDEDGNGLLDPDEDSVTTDANGAFSFDNLPAGTYEIAIVTDPGELLTHPAGGIHSITLNSGETVSNADFGLVEGASIGGLVYEDLDADGGQDPGDPPLANVTVWLDLNEDGILDVGEPTATTNVDGEYLFEDVPPGTYMVRVDAGTQIVLDPVAGLHVVAATSGGTHLGNNFGLIEGGTISGMVWDDLNEDGLIDPGEVGLDGEVVYIDENNNGVLDAVERSVLTSGGGLYSFTGLLPGLYSIRIDVAAGRITFPAIELHSLTLNVGDTYTDQDFGLR